MLKKTITYEDYNGNEITEEFRFHLTKAELAEMQLSKEGGFAEWLEKIVKSRNNPEIAAVFKKILLASYGVVSDDGKRFIKNDQLREEFTQTEAYSQIYMDLLSNEQTMADFVNGVMPKDLVNEIKDSESKSENENN